MTILIISFACMVVGLLTTLLNILWSSYVYHQLDDDREENVTLNCDLVQLERGIQDLDMKINCIETAIASIHKSIHKAEDNIQELDQDLIRIERHLNLPPFNPNEPNG